MSAIDCAASRYACAAAADSSSSESMRFALRAICIWRSETETGAGSARAARVDAPAGPDAPPRQAATRAAAIAGAATWRAGRQRDKGGWKGRKRILSEPCRDPT